MKASITSNAQHAEKIRTKLRENGGYCPCALVKTKDTHCMCKDFLENVKVGQMCHCGLYRKEEN